jgi:hypothetical protein
MSYIQIDKCDILQQQNERFFKNPMTFFPPCPHGAWLAVTALTSHGPGLRFAGWHPRLPTWPGPDDCAPSWPKVLLDAVLKQQLLLWIK